MRYICFKLCAIAWSLCWLTWLTIALPSQLIISPQFPRMLSLYTVVTDIELPPCYASHIVEEISPWRRKTCCTKTIAMSYFSVLANNAAQVRSVTNYLNKDSLQCWWPFLLKQNYFPSCSVDELLIDTFYHFKHSAKKYSEFVEILAEFEDHSIDKLVMMCYATDRSMASHVCLLR